MPIGDSDIIPFSRCVEAFVKLTQREVELMKLTLPEKFHNQMLDLIVSDTINEISNESGFFVQHLRDSTARNRLTHLKQPRGKITSRVEQYDSGDEINLNKLLLLIQVR